MRNRFLFIVLLSFSVLKSQKIELEPLLDENISIRALETDGQKVWYAGTDSKFGYVNLMDFSDQKQIRLSDRNLQFRTLAQDKDYFYTINIESPAIFFRIDKKNLNSETIFTDTLSTAFYDAFTFVGKDRAYAFSDPDKNQNLRLAILSTKGKSVKVSFAESFRMNDGEAAFAASNSNIAAHGKYIWIATGGKSSRIIRINIRNNKTEIFTTPFIQGTSSRGMYTVDFADENFGIAAGGDYTDQEANTDNIATTDDGGHNWQIQASGSNAGYITCVKIRPGSAGKEIIAVGDQHISFSSDFGKTWKKISDEKNLYVCHWIDSKTLVFAGKNRILKAKFSF